MKRIFYLFVLAAAVLLVSCEKSPKLEEGIVAEWQLMDMTGCSGDLLPSVYIDFRADKSFEIYQKVGDVMRYKKYTGEYTLSGTTLTGEYSDGEDWGSPYRVSLEADGEVLVLTALETDKTGNILSDGEVCRYAKASLDPKEKDAADLATKSEGDSVQRFL